MQSSTLNYYRRRENYYLKTEVNVYYDEESWSLLLLKTAKILDRTNFYHILWCANACISTLRCHELTWIKIIRMFVTRAKSSNAFQFQF